MGAPLAAALAWPPGGALLAGGLTGTDRADWFATALGACVGGLVRRPRAVWAAKSFVLTVSAAVLTATVGWAVVALIAAGWAGWACRAFRRGRGE